MNKINIEPASITIIPERTLTVPERKVSIDSIQWTTTDDAFARRLIIRVNGQISFTIEGAEYDALGNWTDDDIKLQILAHYALVEA